MFAIAKSNLRASQDAQASISDLFDQKTLTMPFSVGLTQNGTEFYLRAKQLTGENNSGPQQNYIMEQVEITLRDLNQMTTNILSDLGTLNADRTTAALQGDVKASTSEGHIFEAERLTANLNLGSAHAEGSIIIRDNQTTIFSERMDVDNFGTASTIYFFSGGVRAIYFNKQSTTK